MKGQTALKKIPGCRLVQRDGWIHMTWHDLCARVHGVLDSTIIHLIYPPNIPLDTVRSERQLKLRSSVSASCLAGFSAAVCFFVSTCKQHECTHSTCNYWLVGGRLNCIRSKCWPEVEGQSLSWALIGCNKSGALGSFHDQPAITLRNWDSNYSLDWLATAFSWRSRGYTEYTVVDQSLDGHLSQLFSCIVTSVAWQYESYVLLSFLQLVRSGVLFSN